MNTSTHTKLLISHFLAIILVSGSIGTFFYKTAKDSLMVSLQTRLENSAALLSQTFNADELLSIASSGDKNTAIYKSNVLKAQDFALINKDVAFVYIMELRDGLPHFVLDSDLEAPASPGDLYEEYIPELLKGFVKPSSDNEIYSDQWGHFLSGYAPVKDSNGQLMIGLDMRADEVYFKFKRIHQAAYFSLLGAVILALVFSNIFARNMTMRIQRLCQMCDDLSGNETGASVTEIKGDELKFLETLFQLTTSKLAYNSSQLEKNQALLNKSHNELEQQVTARTQELTLINEQLTKEIAERKRVEIELTSLSATDPLTHLLNRRAMMEVLEGYTKESEKIGSRLFLLMVDADHFKQINDRYGHSIGDKALQHIAETAKQNIGLNSEIARWGGEEFLIALHDMNLKQAQDLAETLREIIESDVFEVDGRIISITCSIGFSEKKPTVTLDECISAADDALYQAKHNGRNQVSYGHN